VSRGKVLSKESVVDWVAENKEWARSPRLFF
jgi:hypothetical protein